MAKRKPQSTAVIEQVGMRRLMEAGMIVAIALGAFLWLSLFSYHQSDRSWSHISNNSHVQNLGGAVGAWVADVALYLFGYVPYIFPLLIIYLFRRYVCWRREEGGIDYFMAMIRAVGFVLFVIGSCGLVDMVVLWNAWHVPYTSGGILGHAVQGGLVSSLNTTGAILVLLAFWLAGVTLLFHLSWGALLDRLGVFTLESMAFIRKQLGLLLTARPKFEKVPDARTIIPGLKPKAERTAPKVSLPVEPLPKSESPRIAPKVATIKTSQRFQKDRQVPLFDNDQPGALPSLTLLDNADKKDGESFSDSQLEEMSRVVETRLAEYGVDVRVVAVLPGPVITRFELQLAPGVKVSKISGLAKDIARSLSVMSVRVVEVIPGKSVIGLELPNEHREIVRLSEVLSSQEYDQAKSPVSLALGKDIAGLPVIVDLARMPHLLVAGTTGSGKSVGVNAMILSLLYKSTPADVRLIMIDPKMLELSVYEGIPHLLTPVITDMKDAASGLRWCVAEMERRYKLMAKLGVRNISGFNQKVKEAIKKRSPIADPLWQPVEDEEPPFLEPLPYIVVVIDEFADMIMVVGKKLEELIARLAQKARAAGIHLILATQRPSVDVITGLIKSNIPTRIGFQVSSKIDSRTILDQPGAEQLLGHGDMLYLAPGTGVPIRVHGAFVADEEVHKVVKVWKKRGEPVYIEEILNTPGGEPGESGEADGAESDPLYDQAVQIVTETRRASISNLQRRMKIGYNRAARLVEDMEAAGIVSPMESNGSREVLAPPPVSG